MKFSMDLMRLLLLELEKHDEPVSSNSIVIEGYTSKEIFYHLLRLDEAGMIKVRMIGESCTVMNMSFAGHQYLEAVRKSRVWEIIKDTSTRIGTGLTIETVKLLASKVVEKLIS